MSRAASLMRPDQSTAANEQLLVASRLTSINNKCTQRGPEFKLSKQPNYPINGTTTTSTSQKNTKKLQTHLIDKQKKIHDQEPEEAIDNGSGTGWTIQASLGAQETSNPIREIIESIDLKQNPEKDVIMLSIGDPTIFGNLKPCKEVLEALRRAELSGRYYGYQTAAGLEEARQAVADYHNRQTGNGVEARDVILASGCSHAIDLCISVLAQAGQNILIPKPGFPLYKTLTSIYGIQYRQYNLLANSNWSIDLEHLESLIDESTAAIVINNPSNPCGSVFDRKQLLQLLSLARRYRKPIIADEIYDKFVFAPHHYKLIDELISFNSNSSLDSQSHSSESTFDDKENAKSTITSIRSHRKQNSDNTDRHSITKLTSSESKSLSNRKREQHQQYDVTSRELFQSEQAEKELPEDNNKGARRQQTMRYAPFIALSSLSKDVPILTCGGISKTCRIPGLRLGWIIINDPIGAFEGSVRPGLNRLTQRLMGPNSIAQGALKDILERVPESFYLATMDFIFKNALVCYQRLIGMPGLQPHMPQGSMYLMCRFDSQRFPTIESDLDFTSKLMNEQSVLVLPGKCFEYPNYFRICLTVPSEIMEQALDRMELFCANHFKPDTASLVRTPS